MKSHEQLLPFEAKKVITQAEGLLTCTSETNGQTRGILCFGYMATLAPELAHIFTEAHPATQVRHVVGNPEELLEGLRRAEVDVALTYDLQIPGDADFVPLACLPSHVLVSEPHPLAGRSARTLQELESEPLLLLDLPRPAALGLRARWPQGGAGAPVRRPSADGGGLGDAEGPRPEPARARRPEAPSGFRLGQLHLWDGGAQLRREARAE